MSQGQTDGGRAAEARPRVEIDTSDPTIRWRYGCPRGHTTIEPTNGGVWCRACANAHDVDDPHYHELLDKETGETIAWDRVRWEGPE